MVHLPFGKSRILFFLLSFSPNSGHCLRLKLSFIFEHFEHRQLQTLFNINRKVHCNQSYYVWKTKRSFTILKTSNQDVLKVINTLLKSFQNSNLVDRSSCFPPSLPNFLSSFLFLHLSSFFLTLASLALWFWKTVKYFVGTKNQN